ncbi:hypothetical protein BCR42DRAFT_455273 [Absidia repens]|uniref:DUF7721 domain-containing protein n=1 Tax=Absidia repens TaxID=90262 RepID=A0A1X2I3Z5_9FUNG|nr:hypothetical protein BCR42DRAFT_455273 [Absidia repens]
MNYGESNSYQGAPQVTYQRPDVNESARYAAQQGGEEHGSMFSSVLSSFLDRDDDDSKRPAQEQEVNEAADAHNRIYNQGGASQASSRDMGKAAALQAFKMFTNKGSSGTGANSGGSTGGGGGGGGGSSELIGLAMGEAMKLLQGGGGAGSGAGGSNQSETLKAAAAMAMKLYASQSGGSGSSGSGGLGKLMGLLGNSGGGGGTNSGSGSGSSGGAASLISKFF